MRLNVKILALLALLITLVLIAFSTTGIYYFHKNQKADAVNSKKLVYSLFLPTLGRYLWEFDTYGIEENINNIILNKYAQSIEVFDLDGEIIASSVLNKSTGKTEQFKHSASYQIVEHSKIKKYLEPHKSEKHSDDFIIINDPDLDSRMIGIVFKKKEESPLLYPYGYIAFNNKVESFLDEMSRYSKNILASIIIITIMLVLVIGGFLRKMLINPILALTQASIDFTLGKFSTVKQVTGKDEMSELIKNFNHMGTHINDNQERLKLLAIEGATISSSVTFKQLSKQVSDAIDRISGKKLNVIFYISSQYIFHKQKIGFLKINENTFDVDFNDKSKFSLFEKEIIKYGNEYSVPENKKRLFVQDNMTGDVSCIFEYDSLSSNKISSYFEKNIYAAIENLQISIANAISNISFIDDQKEQQKLISEQETARLVQSNLLPSSELKKIGAFELSSFFQPAEQCAGDWWSYYTLGSGRLLILLGDVTGHGTASALVSAVVKGYCDSIEDQDNNLLVEDILTKLDRIILNSAKQDRVMTMFAVILDSNTGEMQYSNAAHNFPFMIKEDSANDKKIISRIIAKGKPLGFKNQQSKSSFYVSASAKINPGDSIFIFSDGLVEAENSIREMFGDQRIKKILEASQASNSEDLKKELIQKFSDFIGTETIKDDISFVICKMR